MSELPQGWVNVSLGEIASFEMGQAPPGSASNFDGHGSIFIKAGEFGSRRPVVREWTIDPKKFASADDVLICVVGATAGKLNLGIDCAIGRSVAAIKPTAAVLQLLLYFQLLTRVDELRAGSTGSAQGVISREMLAGVDVALPPLNEQKRIADKLDAVLVRVDACRERLDRIPAILRRLRQSVLSTATSGKLTEGWQRAIEDKWRELPLSQVARVIDPNPSHRYPSYENGSIPIIATEQFEGRDGYNLSKAKLVNPSFYEERLASHGFHCHDIVFARKGRLGLARKLPHQGKFVFSHTIFIIRSFDPTHAPYLLWYLRQDECVEWLLREMNSNQGVPTLGKSFIEKLPVRLPPADEQHEIVRRVESLFTYADRLEVRYAAARVQVECLTPVLLAKAFRGKLVPQDPNDEPASVLLERIRAARAVTEEVGAKPRQRKARVKSVHKSGKEDLVLEINQVQPDHLTVILKEQGRLSPKTLWQASQLGIEDFYEQLRAEEEKRLLREVREDAHSFLEVA